jgi:preprotein translocase subunit SecE
MTDTEMIYAFFSVLASSAVVAIMFVLVQISLIDKD